MATNAVVFKGATAALTEQPGSPAWGYGDRATCTRAYRGVYAVALAAAVPKGTAGTGEMLGYAVGRCTVVKEKFGIGLLKIEWETAGPDAPGATLPPDESQVAPFEIHPAVERAAAFAGLTTAIVDRCYTAARGGTRAERQEAYDWLETNGTAAAKALRDELVKGAETYYLAGLRYEWTAHYYTLPALTEGGFIQSPLGPAASVLPATMQFLRLSDGYTESAGLYRVVRSWLGAPSGHWSAVIYAA